VSPHSGWWAALGGKPVLGNTLWLAVKASVANNPRVGLYIIQLGSGCITRPCQQQPSSKPHKHSGGSSAKVTSNDPYISE